MKKLSLAGLLVDAISKDDLLAQISQRLQAKTKTFVITPYSEFLYEVLVKPKTLEIFNRADIAVCDGIGVMWAAKFLSLKLHTKSYYLKILETLIQAKLTLAAILLYPKYLKSEIPEKIPGSELIWDLCSLAEQQNKSVYLLGGFGETPNVAATKLIERFPKLRVAGSSNKNPGDESIFADLEQTKPDLLFVAFGPITQEKWIAENWDRLPVNLAIGVGGTLDYLAGTKKSPPKLVRAIGLEWLFRLFTQPKRLKRIKNATYGLVLSLIRYKVFSSTPYRRNVVVVVLNQAGQILLCQRKPISKSRIYGGDKNFIRNKFLNYWQFPQGGIDPLEDIEKAATRELFEETGITSVTLLKQSLEVNRYTWNNALRPLWFNRLKFQGQSQHVLFFRFIGEDSEIKLDNHEFVNYQWVNKQDLPETLHEERKPLLEIINQDLALF